MTIDSIEYLWCYGEDHNPNPCRIVLEGALCVECNGLIPKEVLNEVQEGK